MTTLDLLEGFHRSRIGAAAWLLNKRFYFYGGESTDEKKDTVVKQQIFAVNIDTLKTEIPKLLRTSYNPPVKTWLTCNQLNSTQLVFFGGQYVDEENDVVVDNETFILDVKNMQFMLKPLEVAGQKPSARCGHTAVNAFDGKGVLYFGGCVGSNFMNDAYILDITQKEPVFHMVEQTGDVPSPRARHAMAINKAQDKVYVFGGIGPNGLLNDLYELELASMNWKLLSGDESGIVPRQQSCAAILNDKLFIFGGVPEDDSIVQPMSVFDLELNQWILELDYTPYKLLFGVGQQALVLDEKRILVLGSARDRLVLVSDYRQDKSSAEVSIEITKEKEIHHVMIVIT